MRPELVTPRESRAFLERDCEIEGRRVDTMEECLSHNPAQSTLLSNDRARGLKMAAWAIAEAARSLFRSRQLPTLNEHFAPYGGGLRMRSGRAPIKSNLEGGGGRKPNIALLCCHTILSPDINPSYFRRDFESCGVGGRPGKERRLWEKD